MSRPPWLVAVVAVVGLAAIIVVQFEGAARTVLWVGLTIGSMTLLGWRRWPQRPPRVPLLRSGPDAPRRRTPHSLAAIEIEVAGAVDEGLREAGRLRSRLTDLAECRMGVEPVPTVVGDRDVMSLDEVERLVAWLERN